MTMFECLKQGFNKLKQDYILFGPYLAFTLINIVYSRQFMPVGESFSSMFMIHLFGQHVFQTLLGFFLIIMLLNLRKGDVDMPLVFSLFSSRFSRYIGMSLLVNVPFLIVLYLGMSMGNMQADSVNIFVVFLLGIGIYIMVPLTAFGYFACIQYVMTKKSITTVFSEVLFFCFKEYRIALRWFWMMLTLNMLQVFILPLTVTNFVFKDVFLAVVQAFILTLIMSFSVLYYKQFVSSFFRVSAKSVDSLDTGLVDSSLDDLGDEKGDGNES